MPVRNRQGFCSVLGHWVLIGLRIDGSVKIMRAKILFIFRFG